MNSNLNPENKSNKTIIIENLLANDFISINKVVEGFSEKLKLILLINDNNLTEKNISEYSIELQQSYHEISSLFIYFYKNINSIVNLNNTISRDQIFQIESILVLFQNKILEKIRKINKLGEFPNDIAESFNSMKYLLSNLATKKNDDI